MILFINRGGRCLPPEALMTFSIVTWGTMLVFWIMSLLNIEFLPFTYTHYLWHKDEVIHHDETYYKVGVDEIIQEYNKLYYEELKVYISSNTIESRAFKKTTRMNDYKIMINNKHYILKDFKQFIKYGKFLRLEVKSLERKKVENRTVDSIEVQGY